MKIEEGLHLIDGTMANCYFLENGGNGILIDSGTKGSGKKVIGFLKSNSFRPDTVLITHYHMDHIGGLSMVYSEFKPSIYVPDAELGVVKGESKPQTSGKLLSKMVGAMAHPEPVRDVKPVSEFKSDLITPMDTHGHTPGSTSYYIEKSGVIFVGDALVNSNGNLKINRTFTLDISAAEESQKKILQKGARLILSGHGKPFRAGN